MKTTTRARTALLIALSVTFLLLGGYSARQYGAAAAREAQAKLLQDGVRHSDAIEEDSVAAAGYKRLTPVLPEVQLRIVQRQWRMALQLLQYMQRARENVELQNETGAYGSKLKILLDDMLERCSSTLADGATLRPEIVWQLYNASGSAKVMSAFVMLESEQNVEKVQGIMRDALADYKAAIEAVDKAGAPALQRNIPRWNFEVLHGEEYVQKFDVAMTDIEKNQALKENLETVMPELGGYGPGEPIETRVKK